MIQWVWSRPSSSSSCLSFPPIPSTSSSSPSSIYSLCIRRRNHSSSISATLESFEGEQTEQLTARERRQLRNERRESKTSNWREEVEEKLLEKKPKKRYASWKEELNLDNLSLLGPQWWIIRVSRISGQETAERVARSLARNYPDIEFKIYAPAIKVKRKLKNGTISIKPKPLVPGCVFLRCVLNKEIHDFIRECIGVGGFIGSKVGNTKKQINRPKPVSSKDMETVFQQAKEEQEKTDRTFEEEQQKSIVENEELDSNLYPDSKDVTKSVTDVKQKRRSKKGKEPLVITNPSTGENDKFPIPGSSIRVVSGPFTEFTGSLRKLDHNTGKATVAFTLFGKESFVNLDVNQIVAETS